MDTVKSQLDGMVKSGVISPVREPIDSLVFVVSYELSADGLIGFLFII